MLTGNFNPQSLSTKLKLNYPVVLVTVLPVGNCAVLGYRAACSANFLPMFRYNLSVPSSGVKNPRPLKMGPIGRMETSVRNYHYTLNFTPEERSSHLLGGGSLK